MGLVADENDRRAERPAPLRRFLQQAEEEQPADDDEAEETLADTVEVATRQMDLNASTIDLLQQLRKAADSTSANGTVEIPAGQ